MKHEHEEKKKCALFSACAPALLQIRFAFPFHELPLVFLYNFVPTLAKMKIPFHCVPVIEGVWVCAQNFVLWVFEGCRETVWFQSSVSAHNPEQIHATLTGGGLEWDTHDTCTGFSNFFEIPIQSHLLVALFGQLEHIRKWFLHKAVLLPFKKKFRICD